MHQLLIHTTLVILHVVALSGFNIVTLHVTAVVFAGSSMAVFKAATKKNIQKSIKKIGIRFQDIKTIFLSCPIDGNFFAKG